MLLAPRKRPPTFANLIDEQTSGDEEWIAQQEVAMGIPQVATRYMPRCSAYDDPTDGEVPPRYSPMEVAGIKCYTNGKQAIWYGEGSKLTEEGGGRTLYRAGGAITCGPLHVITRVTGPQTSYRAELQSFAFNSALASANQELTYDKAVVDHALHFPHRECSDMDLRLTIQEETRNKPHRSSWVPSHRDITKAKQGEHKSNVTMRSTVWPKWQLAHRSLNTRLPTQLISRRESPWWSCDRGARAKNRSQGSATPRCPMRGRPHWMSTVR